MEKYLTSFLLLFATFLT